MVLHKDALHIACSVYLKSDYLITVDKQLYNLRCAGSAEHKQTAKLKRHTGPEELARR
jgi:hypothetical protein